MSWIFPGKNEIDTIPKWEEIFLSVKTRFCTASLSSNELQKNFLFEQLQSNAQENSSELVDYERSKYLQNSYKNSTEVILITDKIQILEKENLETLRELEACQLARQLDWTSFENILSQERNKLVFMVTMMEQQCKNAFTMIHFAKIVIRMTEYQDQIKAYQHKVHSYMDLKEQFFYNTHAREKNDLEVKNPISELCHTNVCLSNSDSAEKSASTMVKIQKQRISKLDKSLKTSKSKKNNIVIVLEEAKERAVKETRYLRTYLSKNHATNALYVI